MKGRVVHRVARTNYLYVVNPLLCHLQGFKFFSDLLVEKQVHPGSRKGKEGGEEGREGEWRGRWEGGATEKGGLRETGRRETVSTVGGRLCAICAVIDMEKRKEKGSFFVWWKMTHSKTIPKISLLSGAKGTSLGPIPKEGPPTNWGLDENANWPARDHVY